MVIRYIYKDNNIFARIMLFNFEPTNFDCKIFFDNDIKIFFLNNLIQK